MAGEINAVDSHHHLIAVLSAGSNHEEAPRSLVSGDIQGQFSFVSLASSLIAIKPHVNCTFKSSDEVSEGWPHNGDCKVPRREPNVRTA